VSGSIDLLTALDLLGKAEAQVAELRDQVKGAELDAGFHRADTEQARARVAELKRANAHVGTPATVDRIKVAHSALSLRWLGDVPGNPHSEYKQNHAEECFICTLLRSVEAAEARVAELEAEREDVRRWFDNKPWQGELDRGSFGGHAYSDDERAIGYGSYRDPRFLPAALAAVRQEKP
jgi:hypothetical protein